MRSGKEPILRKIKDGTIIDHIPAGQALNLLRLMGITGREGFTLALVMNVESRKLGRKDIIKVEGLELKPEDTDKIALIAPMATINVVRNYEVVEKRKAVPPKVVEGALKCRNPNCITNKPNEPIKSKFRTISYNPPKLVCEYCGHVMTHEDIVKQLLSEA
ncbi:MAG: aspartate carbamoyltransferase regulatory subunit [Thaumarchaeota archaeon]|nr:MAG: aspartate carbamoyltransferase regulatory subunit [Nitrososphaerota archaeon]